jgi:hypothetical protein
MCAHVHVLLWCVVAREKMCSRSAVSGSFELSVGGRPDDIAVLKRQLCAATPCHGMSEMQ